MRARQTIRAYRSELGEPVRLERRPGLNAVRRCLLGGSIALAAVVSASCNDGPDRDGPVEFPERWIDGTDRAEPSFQVHELAAGTWVIRQSLTSEFESRPNTELVGPGAEDVARYY